MKYTKLTLMMIAFATIISCSKNELVEETANTKTIEERENY